MKDGEGADDLDFGRYYCVSGIASCTSYGGCYCFDGPPAFGFDAYAPASPISIIPSSLLDRVTMKRTTAIVGGLMGAFAALLLLLAILWRKRKGWGATNKTFRIAHGQNIDNPTALGRENVLDQLQSPRGQLDNTVSQATPELIPLESRNTEGNRRQYISLQSQQGWISRVLVFLALEMAYMSLVIIACFQPIVIQNVPIARLTEVKGVTTVLTIAWQTLALLPITDIVMEIFSSEWSHIFRCTHELDPGKTDVVSIQTAGILDRLKHFYSSNASLAFRLAFPVSLLSVALTGIAPGALTVETRFFPTVAHMRVGNIDISRMGSYSNTIPQRAAMLTQVEQVEHQQYSMNTSEAGVIVGWPELSPLTESVGDLTYPSDMVQFDYHCYWKAPSLVEMRPGGKSHVEYGIWAVDGNTAKEEWWTAYGPPLLNNSYPVGGIFPLIQSMGDDSVPRTSSSGISAWLFMGTNSSFDTGELKLDLGDVPATTNNSNWIVAECVSCPWVAAMASILLCDPQIRLSSTYVSFTRANNTLSISPSTPPSHVGNISPASAALVLAQSLLSATAIDKAYKYMGVNLMSASLFIQEPLKGFLLPGLYHVRSASNISSTIGPYVLSASKAWSDGFYSPGKFSTMPVHAIKEQPRLALVGSRPLAITAGSLAIIVLGLTVVQLSLPVGEPLGIGSLTKAIDHYKDSPA